MAPVTIAGAVAQQTAEALCAIALLQCVRPGAPVVYGSFTSNVDMKSGRAGVRHAGIMRATQISGQMARFYDLPLRASNACAANAPDGQAAWESAFSLWACATAKANVVYHAAGWLEGGLIASYEKFVMDCETLQQVVHYLKPVPISDADIAVDAIREVGPARSFLGAEHTQGSLRDGVLQPDSVRLRKLSRTWSAHGSIENTQRATRSGRGILAEFEPPPLDPAIDEELRDFVERGGARSAPRRIF
jgi:trimethylamine--corrinoid protein Co-methyltransferase